MNPHARILVATDIASDGSLVRKLLSDEFDNVTVSAIPDRHLHDFDKFQPEVLILAFETLEKAESYYMGLYRLSVVVHTLAHRTLVLCNKDDLKQVYELCKSERFDDYILFWPLVHDTPRLPMAVIHALKSMDLAKENVPTVRRLAMEFQQVKKLGRKMADYSSVGIERLAALSKTTSDSHRSIDSVLEKLSTRLSQGELSDLVEVKNPQGLQDEIAKLMSVDIGSHARAVADELSLLDSWVKSADDFIAPQKEAMKGLQEMVDQIKPQILIVDDDPLQMKIFEKIFSESGFDPLYAASGVEALKILRWRRPDAVLMDIELPDMSGIDVTRRMKNIPELDGIPVIMITGHSEKNMVVDSMKAGANGFIVKPFDKLTILAKLASLLGKVS